MSISINPIFPVIAAQGASPDLVLQPGTVIDADRDIRSLDRGLLGNSASGRAKLAASGIADAGRYQARGGRARRRRGGRQVP